MPALAEELDRRDADVAFLIVNRLLQEPHCAGASDRGQRFDDSQLQLAFTALEQRTHPVRCTRQLEPAGEPHHLQLHGRIGASQCLQYFRRVGLRQAFGGVLHEALDALVRQLRQPAHQRPERVGAQLAEQVAQLVLARVAGRLIE